MLLFKNILQIIILFACCHSLTGQTKKSWTFELISIKGNSSDEKLLKFNLKSKRITRGVYGIQGTIAINADVKENDDTMIEASVSRSITGSSEYESTPFAMKKQHLYDFLNKFYKEIMMDSLAKCSNLPVFKDKFQPPLEKKIYKLENCKISNEGLPQHMSEGYYKIKITGSGKPEYVIEAIMKVETDV